MVWRPPKGLGLAVGLVIPLGIVGIDVFLLQSMVRRPPDIGSFAAALLLALSLPLLALCVYWYYELLTLRYHLDRNGLVIAFGTCRHIVPMSAIQSIISGDEVEPAGRFRGIGWPGYLKGRLRLKEAVWLLVRSTEPLRRQLVVVTESECYGISPQNPSRFVEDWMARRKLGFTRETRQGLELARLAGFPVWHDRGFWVLVILGLAVDAVLFGLVMSRYGDLPPEMTASLNARSQAAGVGSSGRDLVVPGIGLLILVINGIVGSILHRRERLGAYLMAGTAATVQALLWLGAAGVLTR